MLAARERVEELEWRLGARAASDCKERHGGVMRGR